MSKTLAPEWSRRRILAAGLGGSTYAAAVPGETRQATGVKAGEMTPDSAVIWARRTAASHRLANGIVRRGHAKAAGVLPPDAKIELLEGAAPGAPGYLRVTWEGGGKRRSTPWISAEDHSGFVARIPLDGLRPSTDYRYTVETRGTRNGRVDGELTGAFRTLPSPGTPVPVTVAMLSCQMYCHMDRPDGFHIYDSIRKLAPAFLLSCGDNVYYDNEDPIANSEAVARYHWERMYSLPTISSCLQSLGGYWQKDDHDLLSDDTWPGKEFEKMKPLSFAQGQRIFRQQVPAPPEGRPMYRTVRAGADLELWLPEARDYRSANNMPDGPAKSIWGAEQKRWLMESLRRSNAAWKVIVNPNPIVGPDRPTKNDNHANPGFAHESLEIRKFLKDNFDGNVISVCGDRHWQYHSVDPATGLHEFGCGPASDEHAAGTPGYQPELHRFHRVKGGFLRMNVSRNAGSVALQMTHCDVMGQPVHSHTFSRRG